MNAPVPPTYPAYERRDVDALAMAILVVIFIIGCVLVDFIVAGMLSLLKRQAAAAAAGAAHPVATLQFPAPRLQDAPSADLAKFRAHEETLLHTYGWVDQKAGVVRLPIDRAMSLLLQRGLPVGTESFTPAELQQQRPVQNGPRPTTSKEEAPP